MQDLIQAMTNPHVWIVVCAYWLFSAFVGALEAPDQNSSKLYRFVFRFLHLLAGNVNRAAMQFKVPGVEP